VDQPLLLLLLPERLERFHLEAEVRELLRAPGVVVVDPSRMPLRRFPPTVAAGLAVGQARRMRLPGTPAAIAILHPLQFYLAGALLRRHPGGELWYGRTVEDELAHPELDAAALERSVLTKPPAELLELAPLRMSELGIVSGPRSGPAA